MKTLGLGMIGCGVVGGGVVRHLERNGTLLAERSGIPVEVRKIAVRDPAKNRGIDPALLTSRWQEVIADPSVDLVLELMGGTTEAREVALQALQAGKPLITANKALLAHHGKEIFDLSEAKKVPVYFEASVAGGIPILKALREGLRANHIHSIHGIINGTCNYILTRMSQEGGSFEEVLREAKELGYAEADESLDVDGIDAAHKAAILASMAYGFQVPFGHVSIEGIRKVEAADIVFARKLGYVLKLLGIIKANDNGAVEVRVHPTLVPQTHVLASVGGVFNAVAVHGDVVGQTLFYGRGAGADATASAVLSDVAEAAIDKMAGTAHRRMPDHNLNGKVLTLDEIRSRYYVRLSVLDQPGVLAQIAAIFGQHGIGISSVFQPEQHAGCTSPLVMFLDYARERDFRQALAEIEKLEVVKEPCRSLRVEDFS
jgi:homoserine dehydrogenase